MYTYVGRDAKGRRTFVDDRGHFTYEMAVCPCCGATNVLAGNRTVHGKKLCQDCSNKIQSIIVTKSRLSVRSSLGAVKRQRDRLKYFVDIQSNGGLVPDWVGELYNAAQRFIQYEESLKEAAERKRQEEIAAQDMKSIKCRYCGKQHLVPIDADSSKRCPECQKRYKTYTALRCRIAVLNMPSCVELLGILDAYELLKKRGYWAPNIAKWRSRTYLRLEALNNEQV